MAKKFEIIGLILIIILNCCQTTTITQQNEPFIGASSSILVNLLEISSNQKNLLNQTCSQHLNELLIGIKNRDQWAIKGDYKLSLHVYKFLNNYCVNGFFFSS